MNWKVENHMLKIDWEMHFLFWVFESQHKLETEAVHINF